MKNHFVGLTAAILVVLWTSACTHTPPQVPASNEHDMHFHMPSANADVLPPDVLATCQRSNIEGRAGHLDEAIRLANECLASHSLPVSVRATMLQQLALLELVGQHARAALDAQMASVDLSAMPTLQLITLAHLYRINDRYNDTAVTLDRLHAKYETAPDIDHALGMAYYDERGWALLGLGRRQEAIDAFTHGIPLQPALAEAYLGRAEAREAIGDSTGARTDYTQFARWAAERNIDTATRRKLDSLGIDAAHERLRPFGNTNPLREVQTKQLALAQDALRSATTIQAKADAYHNISMYFDGIEQSENALSAINRALALAPDSSAYTQSKVVTLVSLNRIDDALALATPLLHRAHEEAAVSARPDEVFARYEEVLSGSAYAYVQRADWSSAVSALVDAARGMNPVDKDYMATLYLYVRAKSAQSVLDNAFFDNYIQHASTPLRGNYRRGLLLYWQGRESIEHVYAQIVMLSDPASIENALAEIWFSAAAYERYVKHDEASSRAYVAQLNALEPYGTNEWMLIRRNAL